MSRRSRVLVWALVFTACAVAGAVVASRTDPFPPGVEDPGARPTGSVTPSGSASPSGQPAPVNARVRLRVRSEHELLVGGTCLSSWSGSIPLRFTDGERLEGEGEMLLGAGGCGFDSAQVQTVLVVMRATGTLEDGLLRVRFQEVSSEPAGSQDLGGFVATLGEIHPSIELTDGVGADTVRVARPDGEGGRYVSETSASAECRIC